MNQSKGRGWSWWTYIFLSVFVLLFRFSHQYQQELAWDIFGYYLPLPATFIYEDGWMDNRAWVEAVNAKYHLTDTLYQISATPDGDSMYFFFLGMAILLLPFFFIGHLWAYLGGYPMDGFSFPYEEALVLGATLYAILGLWYFRKWLLLFLQEKTVALLMILLVVSTNYFVHGILKNLETVSFLFTGAAMVLYFTHRIHTDFQKKHLIGLCAVLAFMILIKPSECIFALIPLLYGVFNENLRAQKVELLRSKKKEILLAFLVGVVIVGVQMTYFLVKTGRPFYDSYINAGVGLDFTHPHLLEALFGYRKGWLLYTPLMLLFFIGLIPFYKTYRKQFWSWMLTFLLGMYIVVSWSEYWYGAAFSLRPMMAWYPFIFLVIGVLWESLQRLFWAKVSLYLFAGFCTFLNLFQYWQLDNGILDPYRTTKEYYWATFLKTEVPAHAEKLKLVRRTFDGQAEIQFPELYREKAWPNSLKTRYEFQDEFCLDEHVPVDELTSNDHVFIEIEGEYHSSSDELVYLALMVKGSKGSYGFKYVDLKEGRFSTLYLTPELRLKSDELQFYFWNPNGVRFEVKDFDVQLKVRQ